MGRFFIWSCICKQRRLLFNQTQLSPCDSRLPLVSKKAPVAVFRPKSMRFLSLPSICSSFTPAKAGYMVAFAGRKYAGRSPPISAADDSNIITSFTYLNSVEALFKTCTGRYFGCKASSGDSTFCLNGEDCAVPNSKCKSNGGSLDCNLSIQLTFSGTDKHIEVLNSWYDVKNLPKFLLSSLFQNLLI